MVNRFIKMLSMFLAIVLLVNMLPLGIMAQELQSSATTEPPAAETAEEAEGETGEIIAEIPEKRTEYSKEFQLSNGLRLATVYAEPVHYKTASGWKDIDNTLVAKEDGTYTNAEAPWSVTFPKELTEDNKITVSVDGYSLSFVMDGQIHKANPLQRSSAPRLKAIRRSKADIRQPGAVLKEEGLHEDKTIPQKLYSKLTYGEVFENTDVVYDLDSNAVKESIVLQQYDETLEGYCYTLYTGELTPQMDDTGHIDLYAPGNDEPVISLPSPYLLDDNGEFCDEVQVTLTGGDGVYTMAYTLPQQWLAAEERAWPVILDPIVKANTSATNIQDRTISENAHISYKKTVFYAGYDPSKGKIRGYLQYNKLPYLNSSDVIINAEFSLYKVVTSDANGVIEVHKVNGSWTSQGIEWNTQPKCSSNISDYMDVKSQGWYTWNVTDIVRDWYTDGNNGLMIKMPNSVEEGTTKRFRQFYSSDYGTTSKRPKLSITIRNNNGLEGYWDYTSASAGRAGSGHVNNFTGNLTWVREDMGFGGAVMPVSINHVYNLNDSTALETGNNSNMTAGNYFGMGNGWRINYSERLYDWKVDDTTSDNGYYIWEDEDGTDHYFKKVSDGKYKDEDGLELTLTNTGSGASRYVIKDKQDNARYFDASGRLRKIENNQKTKSSITITYDGDSQRIKTITDSASRQYKFTYSEDGLLTSISYYGSGTSVLEKITYEYDSNNNLTKIKEWNPETNKVLYTCTYAYSEAKLIYSENGNTGDNNDGTPDDGVEDEGDASTNNNEEQDNVTESEENTSPSVSNDASLKRYISVLTGATDPSDYKLTYEYYCPTAAWRPYRVKSITEKEGANEGGKLSLAYGHNQTTFTDHKGKKEIHQFDDFGHTVCVQDDQGRAQFSEFTFSNDAEKDSNENTAMRSNQLTLSSELQYSVANLMLDNSMESAARWSSFGIDFKRTQSTACHSTDSASIKLKKENIDGVEGEDFGIFYDTPFIIQPGQTQTFSCDVRADTSVYLQARSTKKTVNSDPVNIYTGWYRQQVSYTNDTDQPVSVTYSVNAEFSGEVYIDCPQLEIANNASRYNLLNDGDFATDSKWEETNFSGSDGYVTLDKPVLPQFNSKVLKITGQTSKKKSVSQKVYMDGKEGDSLIFAGWAKGNSASLGTFSGKTRKFAIECQLVYDDETKSKVYSAVFNPDSNDWQYTAGGIVAEKDFNRVCLSVVYDYNVNSAMFDGIQLFKEAFGTTFDYTSGTDSKRVVTVTDCNNQKTVYTYDKNDNLVEEKLPSGVTTTNSYDEDHHNLTKSVVSDGVTTTYTYDAKGNNTKVTVSDGSKKMTTSSTYDGNGILLSTTDNEGLVTNYQYDKQTGLLKWTQQTANGETLRTTYEYDALYRQTGQSLGKVTTQNGTETVSPVTSAGYAFENDQLTGITTPTTTYGFTYGAFSQRTKATVGSRTLAEYTYSNDADRQLLSLDYGNGDKVQYTYDSQGRVTKESYEDNDAVIYTYDNAGGIATVTDSSSGIRSEVIYSAEDQLSRYTETGGDHDLLVRYKYDTMERISSILYMVDNVMGKAHNSTYTYDARNRLSSYRKGNGKLSYTYDKFERTTRTKLTHSDGDILTTEYTFLAPVTDQTSNQVNELQKTANGYDITYNYSYDARGNITAVWHNSDTSKKITYRYDSQNQLVRENNPFENYTHTWTYDTGGNIQCRKEYAYTTGTLGTPTKTVNYTYGDATWGDLLTAYDGQAITYDAIGNPISMGGKTFQWEHGRELASLTESGTTWNFTYNADGLRTKRTNGTLTYDYVYYGGQLMYMMAKDTGAQSPTKGNHHFILSYTPEGIPMGITYQGTAYYYLTNLQGDVVAILNNQGQRIISYSYDAWGNLLNTEVHVSTDNANYFKYSTIAEFNPLRYRGYVYDAETGLYYLQSRYYNPEIGRFINADNQISTGDFTGLNMFAYCGNNPVIRIDPTGEAWGHWLLGAAVVAGFALLTVATCGGSLALAATSVCLVGSGVAAATTATTVAAAAFIGATVTYCGLALDAMCNSDSADEFAEKGNWGTVAATAGSALLGGASGYSMSKAQASQTVTDDEPFLPDSFYSKHAPKQSTPNSSYTNYTYNNYTGKYEKTTAYYDFAGRQTIRIDWTNHGYSNHGNPHVHYTTYNSQYRDGFTIRWD